MNNPLISIIVPAYNVEQYLPVCLSSIEQQTYQNFEVILVDDGSPDGSAEIIKELRKMSLLSMREKYVIP